MQCLGTKMSEDLSQVRVITSSNWEIDNNKNFDDCISTALLLQFPDRY